jgi:hypothetical protein
MLPHYAAHGSLHFRASAAQFFVFDYYVDNFNNMSMRFGARYDISDSPNACDSLATGVNSVAINIVVAP